MLSTDPSQRPSSGLLQPTGSKRICSKSRISLFRALQSRNVNVLNDEIPSHMISNNATFARNTSL